MLRRFAYPIFVLCLCTMIPAVWSGGASAESSVEPAGTQLDWSELHELFADKTATCRKEKDQSECLNYFSPNGEIVQVMTKSGKRKDGRWFLDDSSRLCFLWNGRLKPLCFRVYPNDDGTYKLIKKGKHLSTLLEMADGNAQNYQIPCDSGKAADR